jgi:hypothetical protein
MVKKQGDQSRQFEDSSFVTPDSTLGGQGLTMKRHYKTVTCHTEPREASQWPWRFRRASEGTLRLGRSLAVHSWNTRQYRGRAFRGAGALAGRNGGEGVTRVRQGGWRGVEEEKEEEEDDAKGS